MGKSPPLVQTTALFSMRSVNFFFFLSSSESDFDSESPEADTRFDFFSTRFCDFEDGADEL